jgi:hypothetical protein
MENQPDAGEVVMNEQLGETARMGSLLRAEVERQLLADLAYYGVLGSDLTIDWSEACGEGHRTRYLPATWRSFPASQLSPPVGKQLPKVGLILSTGGWLLCLPSGCSSGCA